MARKTGLAVVLSLVLVLLVASACQKPEEPLPTAGQTGLLAEAEGTAEPSPTPTPALECISQDEAAAVAVQHVSATEGIPGESLRVQVTGVRLRTVALLSWQIPEDPQKFIVGVDCQGEIVDLAAARAAAAAARWAKYGKLSPQLNELLNTLGPDDVVKVITRVLVEEGAIEAAAQRIREKYPEAHLAPEGVSPSRDTPLELYDLFIDVIRPEYGRALVEVFLAAGTPLAEWLSGLGYEARASTAAPFVYAVVPKSLIEEIGARADVASMDSATLPELLLDSAAPSEAAPSAWMLPTGVTDAISLGQSVRLYHQCIRCIHRSRPL